MGQARAWCATFDQPRWPDQWLESRCRHEASSLDALFTRLGSLVKSVSNYSSRLSANSAFGRRSRVVSGAKHGFR